MYINKNPEIVSISGFFICFGLMVELAVMSLTFKSRHDYFKRFIFITLVKPSVCIRQK